MDVCMNVLNYLNTMAKSHKEVTILPIGNTVSVSGTNKLGHVIQCSSCEKADVVSDALQQYYDKKLS